MNQEQAQQSLKFALTTLLKTPPDYWDIQEDLVTQTRAQFIAATEEPAKEGGGK